MTGDKWLKKDDAKVQLL